MTRATLPRSRQAGFSLVELLVAVVVLMVGVVAVARLVPTAMQSNTRNRYDSTALILAQRQLDLMVAQDIRAGFPVSQAVAGNHNYYFCVPPGDLNPTPQVANCPNGTPGPVVVYAVGLSNLTATDATPTADGADLLGGDVVTGDLEIDWSQPFASVPAGYKNRFTLSESGLVAGATQALGGANYETRWNVLTIFGSFNGFVRPVAKRITISVRGGPEGTVQRPATLTTWVAWEE
jgi:prepilin-type N-terminal cleavage/methylation domain-containing protein